ncbi:VOC family protein [Streptomyces uncialis]|uniref:VOC family protein n=1 Tax=Streptomyces uncialis TaxID=1048205 RepID=UPI003868CDB0|nr:VOC family protein [Streptomyces uncialis]
MSPANPANSVDPSNPGTPVGPAHQVGSASPDGVTAPVSSSAPGTARPRVALSTVVLECSDAHELAAFYQRLLGWEVERQEPDWVKLRAPGRGDGSGDTGIALQSDDTYVPPVWPGVPGAQQMMAHLDFEVADLAAATAYAVASGAALATHQAAEDTRVLFDPAGHPFCLWTKEGTGTGSDADANRETGR